MTREAVEVLAAEREDVLRVCRELTPEEWEAPSACDGWSVQDVLAHMASLFHPSLTAIRGLASGEPVEELNDRLVGARRGWAPDRQLAEYETWSRRAGRLLAVSQRPPLSRIPLAMGDLGRHPLHLLANATAFDHYAHLHLDVLAPSGPVERSDVVADPIRLGPVVEWMLRIVPTLCDRPMAWMDRPVGLKLHGPGGGTWTIHRVPAGVLAVDPGLSGVAATVVSTTPDFVVWGTRRAAWTSMDLGLDGDPDLAERFLDAFRVF